MRPFLSALLGLCFIGISAKEAFVIADKAGPKFVQLQLTPVQRPVEISEVSKVFQ